VFDVQDKGAGTKRRLPAAAKKVESLTELLATSDIVSLHCAVSRGTVQLINGEALRSMKPGTFTWFFISHSCTYWGF
jgi:phosphoglycerate dehydrogenase-like enzyme